MNFTRRTFLGTAAVATLMPTLGQSAIRTLTASNISAQILPGGTRPARMMGFNGSTPGPILRVKQGETLSLRFQNQLKEGSAVHWHGIRLANGMDGVPDMTQSLINPGDGFNYSFQTPDAGTYWYHSHYLSYEQVERGLYGALIVDDPTPPDVDHDIVAVIDDWLINEAGELDENFGNRHELSHAGRVGNFARAVLSQDTVRLGDRIRLRMINAATARVFALNLAGLNGQVVALDGMNLSQPLPMDTLTLAPAQRIDLIADVVAAPDISFRTRRGNYLLGSLALDGENANRGTGPIPALAQTNVVAPDLSNSIELTLNMQGGAMARGHGGDDLWAFNDVSGLPNVPFGTFQRGQTAVINLVNRTSFPHGMHLHGHHFSELTPDGQLGPYRDTTLVEAGESRKIACVFDNPGRWLFHCHMLGHQAAGMKTWVTVA